jgi:Raf kinase inhibitor-like YbhB/YbcL family protein
MTAIDLSSSAFGDREAIPMVYGCDGEEVSPPLTWDRVPGGAAELLLFVHDPDAPGGDFVHWIVAGIDPATAGFDEGAVAPGVVEGSNGFGRTGWAGPCPPPGDQPHHYVFTLYVLGEPSKLAQGATADEVYDVVDGPDARVLAQGELVGTYQRHPTG